MKRKILIVDDSALMRSVLCDIINSDERFQVEDRATNGLEALELLKRNIPHDRHLGLVLLLETELEIGIQNTRIKANGH